MPCPGCGYDHIKSLDPDEKDPKKHRIRCPKCGLTFTQSEE